MTDVAILCDALCHVLGNTCRIIRTTRSYEWNVSGRGAELARRCFCEHATEQQRTVERVAYHIIGLRGSPILDYSDEVLEVDPPTKHDIPSLRVMVERLCRGHAQADTSVNAAADLAREFLETATVNLLVSQSEMHGLHSRRLELLRGDT